MTEIELEGLLQSAFNDGSIVPEEINQRLKKKLFKKYRYKKMLKSVPVSAAACLLVGALVVSVYTGNDNKNDMVVNPVAVNDNISEQTPKTMNLARGAVLESSSYDKTLISENVENLKAVTKKVKEFMVANPEYEFYEDFRELSGSERCYFEESGELVVIFDAGIIAPEEHGEIFINVGIIN